MSRPRAVPRYTSPQHVHLPSVHIRRDGAGYDYEEDYFTEPRGTIRAIRFVAIAGGEPALIRETTDQLSPEDFSAFQQVLELLDDDPEEVNDLMQERARNEFDRQRRIAAGTEQACASCGCSDSKSCSGGCVWATAALCSRCIL